MSVAVVDYGVSNIASVLNMLERLSLPASAATSPAQVQNAERILLPGVGSFDHGIQELRDRGLDESIVAKARSGTPIFGICLGMQLLGLGSAEGNLPGLGLINARAERIPTEDTRQIRVPHMGWNVLAPGKQDPWLDGLSDNARFYFVHSYHLVCDDPNDSLAVSRHGIEFTAMVRRGNVTGAQFHPEKSHQHGMKILTNFANAV